MKRLITIFALFILYAGSGYAQLSVSLAGSTLVTTGWSIGGFATAIDSFVQLTNAGTDENGYVYYDSAVNLTSCAEFSVKFDYQITGAGGAGVADGIAFFYIATPPAGFISGGGLGLPNPLTGMVFTLDTWDNDGDFLNPESQIFGYNTPSVYSEANRTQMIGPINGLLTFMDDGTWHHCEIDYNAGNISVYYDYSTLPGMTGFYLITIPSGYFGFSSSTGAGYSIQNVKSIYITANGIEPRPTVTSPITYCENAPADSLTATGTGPFRWFTTDTATVVSLPHSPTPNTSVPGTTKYFVRQGSGTCISPPDSIEVIVTAPPPAPVITGKTIYCQGTTFVPFTVSGYTGTLEWYTTGAGGTASSVPLAVSTAIPGLYKIWVSQVVDGCEGPRDSIAVRIITTPPPPTVTGTFQYCQYVGTFTDLSATSAPSDTALWYTSATGGAASYTEPTVNINVSGAYNSWVSQTDSGCNSPRTPVTINVYPKPTHPVITPQGPYCQYTITSALTATASETGDYLTWFGAGIAPTGTSLTPTPQANIAGLDSFYIDETSVHNCVSDTILDTVRIIPKPATPLTRDTSYCQNIKGVPLNVDVDSAGNGGGDRLNWYQLGAQIDSTPIPLNETPGLNTWYVSQTINGCQGDSAQITVTTLYVPKFTITPSSPWVCQLDSITLAFNGAPLQNSAFLWSIPVGDSLGTGSTFADSMITVKFDSANLDAFVTLRASDYFGKCVTTDTIAIKVVPQPVAIPFSKAEVCFGDTTSLAVASQSADANSYVWNIDFNTLLGNSTALNIIAASSNSGGPFEISWLDTGLHIIQLNSFTIEGCASKPYYDTVLVHAQPDASFSYKYNQATLCLEDSVYFTANTFEYNNSYLWAPAHSFTNIDKPAAFGVLEQNQTAITLTVTDPFGCTATTTQLLDPGSCCTVAFPNAFTPNGDGHDDVFRPLFTGFHNFHIFRIQNRWGQTVFESTNSAMQWDGTFNGVPQDMGVYFYYIKYDCGGKSIEASGDVTLIR